MKPKIVIAAANGFIGSYLVTYFSDLGYAVVGLVRKHQENKPNIRYVCWDGRTIGYWTRELEGAVAVINLAGRTVDCRYTPKNRNEIYNSRLDSTYIIGKAIMALFQKPQYWINAASATIYRHSLDRPMTESAGELGSGFSVDVCKKWEEMFFSFRSESIHLVGLRIAITLADNGGVMIPLRNLVRIGLGGAMGSGTQMFSWIHISDLARGITHILENKSPQAIYNFAHPEPITNGVLMKKLRAKFNIPFGLPIPAWLLKIGAHFIRTETELVLKSRFVIPENLLEEGFQFSVNEI